MKPLLKIAACVLLIGATSAAQNAGAQDSDEKNKNDNTQPIAKLHIQFQLAKTNGTEILIEHDLPDAKKKPKAQTYIVMVPVHRTVIKEGKPEVITSYVQQQRTRMVRPTIRQSMPLQKNQVFKDVNGNRIAREKVIGMLGMGQGRYVVQLNPTQNITPQLRRALAKDTIILVYESNPK